MYMDTHTHTHLLDKFNIVQLILASTIEHRSLVAVTLCRSRASKMEWKHYTHTHTLTGGPGGPEGPVYPLGP